MDKTAFEKIVNENGKDILRFCRMQTGNRDDGDELYQDTMLTLFERLSKLDENMNVKSYAISVSLLILKNKKRKFARRQRIVPIQSMDQMLDLGEKTADPADVPLDELVISREEKRLVRKAVMHLPEKYRTVILMYYSAQMSVREISEALHIPQGTVKTRMQKAKEMLKKELDAHEEN